MKTPSNDRAGVLYVVSAPSGAGKTTLVRALVESEPHTVVSVSHTTRPPREGEVDGVHYHFVDVAVFDRMEREGLFLEHAEVFGNRYGTSRRWVQTQLAANLNVVLEIDWQGARQIAASHPCTTVFILPPSIETLAHRLRSRGQDGEEVIARRLAAAVDEINHFGDFDFLVVNDRFDAALADLRCVLRAGRLHRRVQRAAQARLLDALLRGTR
jgi:guanylate kinase